MTSRGWRSLTLTLALAGCGGDEPGELEEVSGTLTVRHVTAEDEVVTPLDLSELLVEAYVPDEGGGMTTIAGTGAADGTFVVPDVPDGTYLLRVGNLVRSLDIRASAHEDVELGRADAAYATQPTPVDLALTGLAPWVYGDDVQLVAPRAGLVVFGAGSAEDGSTTINSSFDWAEGGFPLIDASQDDELTVVQIHESTPSPSGQVFTAQGWIALEGLTIEDGVGGTIAGALAPLAQDQATTINWRRSAFNGAPTDFGAGGLFESDYLIIDTLPRSGNFGWYDASTDLAWLLPQGAPTDDWNGPITFGNPFPQAWGQFVAAHTTISIPLRGDDRFYASSETVVSLATMEASGIGPVVGPVRNVKVDGVPLTDGMAGVGLDPVVSWDPPLLGAPTVYRVRCGTIVDDQLVSYQASGIRTTETSVRLAPGSLEPGAQTFFAITAFVEGAPFPSGHAEMVTGVFSP